MMIGIDQATWDVYIGAARPDRPIWPSPLVSYAKAVVDRSAGYGLTHLDWVFLEHSFDPVTRVRRGRLYEPSPTTSDNVQVLTHPTDFAHALNLGATGPASKNLHLYNPCDAFFAERRQHKLLAIGQGDNVAHWRVLQAERIVGRDILVTLKSLSSFGVLPDIDSKKIPSALFDDVSAALERVIDSAPRESPISVIDQCRNAMTVILSRWLISNGADDREKNLELGKLVSRVRSDAGKIAAADAAEIVRLLHPRGKASSRDKQDLRTPTEEDAEFALQAVGFVIREIGWSA